MFWPLQENVVSDDQLELLVEFIRSTKRFTQYEKVFEFESLFAKWNGSKYAVFVNSGSSANFLLLASVIETFNLKPGDEVLVPAVTWPTTFTPVIQLGLKPVYVDVNIIDFSFNYETLKSHLTSRTKAVFCAHLLGCPADVNFLNNFCSENNLLLLEDCCEAQGSHSCSTKVGNFGVGGTFSFYWGHHMTTVEGGMIVTNNESLYHNLLLKRSHGLARELPEYLHESLRHKYQDLDFRFLFLTDGYNFRNTEFAAVLGISQLEKINHNITLRNQNFNIFCQIVRDFSYLHAPSIVDGISSFVLPFILKDKSNVSRLKTHLSTYEIETRPLISGNLMRQPFIADTCCPESFPNAEYIHDHCFYIGNNHFVNSSRLDSLKAALSTFS